MILAVATFLTACAKNDENTSTDTSESLPYAHCSSEVVTSTYALETAMNTLNRYRTEENVREVQRICNSSTLATLSGNCVVSSERKWDKIEYKYIQADKVREACSKVRGL